MTKVDLTFPLLHQLDDLKLLDAINRVHGVYGMQKVVLAQTMDKLFVEYDATRLNPLEVEATLQRFGLPVGAASAPGE